MKRFRSLLSFVLAIIMALTVFAFAGASDSHAAAKPSAPAITSLTSTSYGCITVKTSSVAKISGIQVQYSKKSTFPTDARTTYKYAGVTSVSKTYKNLTRGSSYYFRVRAYRTANGTTAYSPWSSVKSVKALLYTTAYVCRAKAALHRDMDTNSKVYSINYRTKVLNYGVAKTTSKAYWYKLKYNGQLYYLWQPKTEDPYLAKTRKSLSKYQNACKTSYQREVIDSALYILQNWTVYYANNQHNGVPVAGTEVGGRYPLDCSNFASYVINGVMQEHVPAYRLTSQVEYMHLQDYMYNRGLHGECQVKTICTGKPNLTALRPGDLVFFDDNTSDNEKYDHVGIYIGEGDFIQCTNYITKGNSYNFIDTKTNVCISPLKDKYYDRFMKAVRVLPTKISSANEYRYINLGNDKATSYTSIYSDFTFGSSTKLGSVYNGTKVELLYIPRLLDSSKTFVDKRAYIRLPDGQEAFIDIEKLSNINPLASSDELLSFDEQLDE